MKAAFHFKCLEYIEIHEPVISVRHNSVGFTFIQQINRHSAHHRAVNAVAARRTSSPLNVAEYCGSYIYSACILVHQLFQKASLFYKFLLLYIVFCAQKYR